MPTIYIDGEPVQVNEGDNLLEACLSLGLDLPYFCWHPSMGSIGACRQCAVVQYQNAEDTRGRIVMGCMTPVTEGAHFSLQADKAAEFRKNNIEALMLNHPHDCPVCAEGGECHLQDMTVMTGHRDRGYRGKKNTHRNQYLGPLVHHEMNRCISCYRCVRFYNDYAGGTDLAAMAAHDHVYFGRHEEGVLESEFSGNLVEVCPTGVFTDKPLVGHYTRKWDLQSAPSICNGCGLGCNTMPGERYGELKRVHNRFNYEVNGYFLCDRGRYGAGFVNNDNRPRFAGLKEDGHFNAITKPQALSTIAAWFKSSKTIVGIGSPRASLESNYLLKQIVKDNTYCNGLTENQAQLTRFVAHQLVQGTVRTPSLKDIEAADAVLILGEDITNTAPRMALSVRQSVRNKAFDLAKELGLQDWQDAAIRNLAQDQLSPLFIASPLNTRLDDVATDSFKLTPDNIACLGFAIASRLNTTETEPAFEAELGAISSTIVEVLKQAKRPLIIAGSGCQNLDILKAAAAVAEGLSQHQCEPMLSYCLPEANSLGVALFDEPGISLNTLIDSPDESPIDLLFVVENDLFNRMSSQKVEQLLARVKHLVVLDCVDNATISAANLALPSAAFTEAEGTLVNTEGRAQRFYPVSADLDDRQASWQWLAQLGATLGLTPFENLQHFDQVELACSNDSALLKGITAQAPTGDYRHQGLKIPRQPHRYSGRTAMRADVSVHEPQQPQDMETPLSFSMEGSSESQPGALIPFVWSPGWNSNQSIQKFQTEAGGCLKGGTPGVRLIEPATTKGPVEAPSTPQNSEQFLDSSGDFLLVPIYRIFGSDELSVQSPPVKELSDNPFVILHPEDAQQLQVTAGDGIHFEGHELDLAVHLDDSLVRGCAGFLSGIAETAALNAGSRVALSKSLHWVRQQPELIATNGGQP